MNLLELLEEVIEGHILPFLLWNDLLRFRRVSHKAHKITTKYMRVHSELAPEIEINEGKWNFGAFLKMDIPTTKIFLNNVSGEEFYENDFDNMMAFLEKYHLLVTTLRVHKISLILSGIEREFPDSLLNLKHFEAGFFAVDRTQIRRNRVKRNASGMLSDPTADGINNGIKFPMVFRTLESIKIGQITDIENILHRTNVLLVAARDTLKYAALPFNPFITKSVMRKSRAPEMLPKTPEYSLAMMFTCLGIHIMGRHEENPGAENLKEFDFVHYHDQSDPPILGIAECGSFLFLSLCGQCVESGTKLRHVGASWFYERETNPRFIAGDLGIPIVSLVNLHHSILGLEMPNLEKLEVKHTFECKMPAEQVWRNQRPEWPSLKCIDITVDSECIITFGEDPAEGQQFKTKDIYGFCFKGIRRLTLTELRLNFTYNVAPVPIPRTDEIAECCPNLKKLTLVNWPGTNKALLKIWEGCQGLEEICLDSCENVGNVTFVGLDTNKPTFFKLKNLTKLSLKGLDKMPKITDLLFTLVISHLRLTQFIITSGKPIETVTLSGIRSLLAGSFATSIEKFSFAKWSLAGVSNAEFKKIETQFRSYEMI